MQNTVAADECGRASGEQPVFFAAGRGTTIRRTAARRTVTGTLPTTATTTTVFGWWSCPAWACTCEDAAGVASVLNPCVHGRTERGAMQVLALVLSRRERDFFAGRICVAEPAESGRPPGRTCRPAFLREALSMSRELKVISDFYNPSDMHDDSGPRSLEAVDSATCCRCSRGTWAPLMSSWSSFGRLAASLAKRAETKRPPRMVPKLSRAAALGVKRTYWTTRCGGLGLSHGILRRWNRHHDSTWVADSRGGVGRLAEPAATGCR